MGVFFGILRNHLIPKITQSNKTVPLLETFSLLQYLRLEFIIAIQYHLQMKALILRDLTASRKYTVEMLYYCHICNIVHNDIIWEIVFKICNIGLRKPNYNYFQHLSLESTGILSIFDLFLFNENYLQKCSSRNIFTSAIMVPRNRVFRSFD